MAKSIGVRQGARGGFTLVELLVVITIIGILMGLLIPAVNSARETARRNQCATQLKNLALATIQFANAKSRLPGYVEKYGVFAGGVDPADPLSYGGAVPRHIKIGTWTVSLLPYLEQQATYERWTEDRYPILADSAAELGATSNESGAGYSTLAAPNLAIMQCPSNPVSVGQFGKNSYAANNGMCHLNTTGSGGPVAVSGVTFADSQDSDNGAFNCKYNVASLNATGVGVHTSEGSHVRLEDFKDGQGNTVLFSENVQALPWHRAGFIGDTNLTITAATETDKIYTEESARYISGIVWHYEDPKSGETALASLWNKNGTAAAVVPSSVNTLHKINGGGTTVSDDIFTKTMDATNSRDLARPSSAHVDGVNASMADGGTRFIGKGVDYRIYQALLTLRGKSSNVPWPEYVMPADAI